MSVGFVAHSQRCRGPAHLFPKKNACKRRGMITLPCNFVRRQTCSLKRKNSPVREHSRSKYFVEAIDWIVLCILTSLPQRAVLQTPRPQWLLARKVGAELRLRCLPLSPRRCPHLPTLSQWGLFPCRRALCPCWPPTSRSSTVSPAPPYPAAGRLAGLWPPPPPSSTLAPRTRRGAKCGRGGRSAPCRR